MARINAYPFITTIADSDTWIGTKTSNGATKQFTASDVAAYVVSSTSGDNTSIVLKSPDGTKYKITVANGGTLSVSAV